MSAERELEEQLKEAGNKLLEPPSSPDELLPLLDQVENFLSRVEQSPAKSMQVALSPLTRALIADELLRHSDVDVKVAVASCISEITRITAPDAPYDDDRMKDVFQLIVSSFENLPDKSSRSYNKRALILETVAKVRSCVVMLDLECDGLIAEMFQLFLGTIRHYHPSNIFSSMETIMTLVLEESEDISPEILTPLLATMKKDNKEVLPVAVKLAEKVFKNCAAKLKPYLSLAIQSLDVSLADYGDIVTSIYEEGSSATRPSDGNVLTEQSDLEDKLPRTSNNEDQDTQAQADESKATASTEDETTQVAKDKEACPEEMDAKADRSPRTVTSNGVDETATKKLGASEEEENGANLHGQPSTEKGASKHEVEDSEAGDKIESKRDHPDGKRGNKSDASTNMSESSDTSHVEGEKRAEELPDLLGNHDKGEHDSRRDINSEAAKPSEKEASTEISSPRASDTEAGNVASPTMSENLQDDKLLKKAVRSKKKESSVQEETPLVHLLPKKTIEGTNDSEAKLHKRSRKSAPADATDEDKMSTDLDTSKISGGGASDSETKKIKVMDKKIDESSNIDEAPSMRKKKDSKRRSRGKAALENEVPKSSSKDDQKEVSSPRSTKKSAKDEESHEETNRITSAKRKRGVGRDKASETLEYGDNLVGSKVKVWWPRDRQYYVGTVDSFDPNKKKHKVLYVDGDEEILNLKKERWEFVEDSVSSDEQTAEHASPDSASGMPKKKKAKTVFESLAKSVAASTSKSKGTTPKSGRKSKDDGKIDLKLKEKISKSGGKFEDDSSGKPNKVNSSKTGGRLKDDSPKPSTTKSKDLDSKTKSKQESPKVTSKSKQETPKTSTNTKSKGKSSQGGGDNSSNGLGKAKHSSSKTKEAGVLRDNKSFDSPKTQEGGKGRSSELKSQENETVSTKKRRRG